MSQAILFDRDQAEHLEGSIADRPRRLSRGKLLWVDLIVIYGQRNGGRTWTPQSSSS